MLDSLLIANRGEIARRLLRTARRLGLRTIAVYSDADRDAPHVREADEALRIGPAPARESYLDVAAIVGAAQRAGAAAVHPGYGFLSENPALPRACEAAGITFVGPTAEVVEAMGSKIGAKRLAVASGVPVVPGFDGDDGSDEILISAAERVGYPLLVKASAGGGGKGMRAVGSPGELPEAVAVARREAAAAFGSDRLLLERLVRRARHVEVQIAADHHGRVVHLLDRDCSVQRNNQKVLEEAPAPSLPDALRAGLLDDAVRLARAIGYRNLGTMEFLVDAETGERFFLEMNTRLQVEHPVTEMITGLDLVEWQLRIASGEPLPLTQDRIRASGHAIEARLAAERPERGFLPATGRIALWRAPAGEGLRVDTGVETGSEVTVHYDSMIAKVIAHGADREEARRRLLRGLNDLILLGPETNRAFLANLLCDGPFAEGRAVTASIKERFPEGWTRPALAPGLAAGVAAAAYFAAEAALRDSNSPWAALRGFRVLAPAGRAAVQEVSVELSGEVVTVRMRIDSEGIAIVAEEGTVPVRVDAAGGALAIRVGGDPRQGLARVEGERVWLRFGEVETAATVRPLLTRGDQGGGKAGAQDMLVAPMPGVVSEVRAVEGDLVEAGAPLVVLESMKLFQTLAAPRTGRVARVWATAGQTVPAGFTLITLELESDPA